MTDAIKVGLFAVASAFVLALVIGSFGGPRWYAVGPLLIFLAYFVKVKVRKLADPPRTVMAIIVVVSLAMLAFAWF